MGRLVAALAGQTAGRFMDHCAGRSAGRLVAWGALLWVLALGPLAAAQNHGAPLPRSLSASARVSLVTVLPGDQPWSLFGHGALRVVDPLYRFDIGFNYGTYEFDEGFLARFVYGELDYRLAVSPFAALVDEARAEKRTVIEQSLDLDGDQRQALYEALMINALPENRTYRYDFLFDNCSTRLVDMLGRVLGPGLVLPRGPDDQLTFRQLLATHLGSHPFYALGIDTALGAELDQSATFEQGWFLPQRLMDAVGRGMIDGRALVSRTTTLHDSGRPPLTARAHWPYALGGALIVLLVLLGLGRSRRGARGSGGPSTRLDGTLLFLCGLTGLILCGLWFATLHHVTAHNGNLLWALPTHLLVAFLLGRSAESVWLRSYLAISGALMIVAWVGGLVGWLQPMPDLLQLIVPALGCRLIWRGLRGPASAEGSAG